MLTLAIFLVPDTSGTTDFRLSNAMRKSTRLCRSMSLCKWRLSVGSLSVSILVLLRLYPLLVLVPLPLLIPRRPDDEVELEGLSTFLTGNIVLMPLLMRFFDMAVATLRCNWCLSLEEGLVGRERAIRLALVNLSDTDTTSISSSSSVTIEKIY